MSTKTVKIEAIETADLPKFQLKVDKLFEDLSGKEGLLKHIRENLYNSTRPKGYPDDAPVKQDFIKLASAINTLKRDFKDVISKRGGNRSKGASKNSGFSRVIKLKKDSPLGKFVGEKHEGYWYVTPSVATQVINVYINLHKAEMISESGRSFFRPDDVLYGVLSPYYSEVKGMSDDDDIKYTQIQSLLHAAYRVDEVDRPSKDKKGKVIKPRVAPSDVAAALEDKAAASSNLSPYSKAVAAASKRAEDDFVKMSKIANEYGENSEAYTMANDRFEDSQKALKSARSSYKKHFAKYTEIFGF